MQRHGILERLLYIMTNNKTIDTLVEDIQDVLKGMGGWDNAITHYFSESMADLAKTRFMEVQRPRNYLSLSSVGTHCDRKLWYKVNGCDVAEELPASAIMKFFFGDMIEVLTLSLAMAAGHTVTGMQSRLNVHGIKGSRDAVIDGVTVDVKSASTFSFKKFKDGSLRDNDPFGYISQLSSYVYGGKDDNLVEHKTKGAFLVVDKTLGNICLDVYDFTDDMANKENEMDKARALVAGPIPEYRIPPVPQSKTSPNMKLAMACSYCEFKKACYPEVRTFLYETGPLFLVDVVTEPRVNEKLNG
jgi:hypothetical protein